MAFNGKEGSAISLDTAKNWTKRYRDENRGEVKAHFFGCEKLRELLDEPGCKGIRIYYGIDENGEKKLVLVGATENQNNILPSEELKGGGMLLDNSRPCPTYCPEDPDDPLT